MDFERNCPYSGLLLEQTSFRNYRVKILSNQINKWRVYTSITARKPIVSYQFSLDPWFLTGFSDAESSFSILIQANRKYKTKWRIKAIFAIGLHKKDIDLLEKIQAYWGVGKIHKHGKDSLQFRVESIKDLQIIINHFENYPLISAKVTDYILFKKALDIIELQEHLNQEGLLKLVGIKASLNLGLNSHLKEAFPNWENIQYNKPDYIFSGIPNPNWMAGFCSGDGSFNIKISKSSTSKLGSRVQLRFSIGLNIREKALVKYLVSYFNLSENLKNTYLGDNYASFQIVNFLDIMNIIIPFFEAYPVQGKKSLDFIDFKKVGEIIKNKEHLTLEGFNKILEIKARMND